MSTVKKKTQAEEQKKVLKNPIQNSQQIQNSTKKSEEELDKEILSTENKEQEVKQQIEQKKMEQEVKQQIESTKMILRDSGEMNYYLLNLLERMNQNLENQNQTLKGIGQALNNIGQFLEEQGIEVIGPEEEQDETD